MVQKYDLNGADKRKYKNILDPKERTNYLNAYFDLAEEVIPPNRWYMSNQVKEWN